MLAMRNIHPVLQGGFGVCVLVLQGGFGVCVLVLQGGFGVCVLVLQGGFGVCVLVLQGGFGVCVLVLQGGFGVCMLVLQGGFGVCLLVMRNIHICKVGLGPRQELNSSILIVSLVVKPHTSTHAYISNQPSSPATSSVLSPFPSSSAIASLTSAHRWGLGLACCYGGLYLEYNTALL